MKGRTEETRRGANMLWSPHRPTFRYTSIDESYRTELRGGYCVEICLKFERHFDSLMTHNGHRGDHTSHDSMTSQWWLTWCSDREREKRENVWSWAGEKKKWWERIVMVTCMMMLCWGDHSWIGDRCKTSSKTHRIDIPTQPIQHTPQHNTTSGNHHHHHTTRTPTNPLHSTPGFDQRVSNNKGWHVDREKER